MSGRMHMDYTIHTPRSDQSLHRRVLGLLSGDRSITTRRRTQYNFLVKDARQ